MKDYEKVRTLITNSQHPWGQYFGTFDELKHCRAGMVEIRDLPAEITECNVVQNSCIQAKTE